MLLGSYVFNARYNKETRAVETTYRRYSGDCFSFALVILRKSDDLFSQYLKDITSACHFHLGMLRDFE